MFKAPHHFIECNLY